MFSSPLPDPAEAGHYVLLRGCVADLRRGSPHSTQNARSLRSIIVPLLLFRDADRAWVVGTQRVGEFLPGVAEIAHQLVAFRLHALACPFDKIAKRLGLLRDAEPAVP